jgi:F-type H+-transporting ATPase subunit a
MWLNKFILVFIFVSLSCLLFANSNEEKDNEFNTVEFIFEHVNDSHEWHFFSVGDKHFSIPLPVIIYSKTSGWHFFLSSKFHHTNENFPFEIAKGGNNDGKIIEKAADGTITLPLDLSITKTILGTLIAVTLLMIFILKGSKQTIKSPLRAPKGIQNIIELLVLFVRDELAKPFAGKEYNRFMPLLLSLFFFILISNLIGLIIPLGFNITGNIAVTLVLALFTFVVTTINGTKHYWLHIVNPEVPWFMKFPLPLIPFIEFIGIFIKPIVLMIRLFANMFAGHMIIAVLITLIFLMSTIFNPAVGFVTSVISVTFSLFMLFVDVLVSFIQAYIFTLLSAMYFGMATEKGEH